MTSWWLEQAWSRQTEDLAKSVSKTAMHVNTHERYWFFCIGSAWEHDVPAPSSLTACNSNAGLAAAVCLQQGGGP